MKHIWQTIDKEKGQVGSAAGDKVGDKRWYKVRDKLGDIARDKA